MLKCMSALDQLVEQSALIEYYVANKTLNLLIPVIGHDAKILGELKPDEKAVDYIVGDADR